MPTFVIYIIIILFIIGMVIAIVKNNKKAVFGVAMAFCVANLVFTPIWKFTSPDSLYTKARFDEELIPCVKAIDWNDGEMLRSNNFICAENTDTYTYYSDMEYSFVRDANLSIDVYPDKGEQKFIFSKDDVYYVHYYQVSEESGQKRIRSDYVFKVEDTIIEVSESYDIRMETDVLKNFLKNMKGTEIGENS
ncbi:MAG: hypothetical protein E7490_07205 [Ruminococcaceae bacterium]|nr:hypothetical protein [Oscillospiraceae bacterium]